ncbi:MAG: putative sugar kinase YdjH [Chloroflexi bacterium]|nr:putative sugar kinase YdjH [Chloroflexota bacterium]
MRDQVMRAAVFGNVTLDIICQTVNHVPRHASIAFERAQISPGGCASNVALGLAHLGVDTTLIARLGDGDAAALVREHWQRAGIDLSHLEVVEGASTGVSVGLVDEDRQPRFVHTPGANARLSAKNLPVFSLLARGDSFLHVAGYFVLPGLLTPHLAEPLAQAKTAGITTSLDVVTSPAMDDPSPLWPCLPSIDYFMCNRHEAQRITGENDPHQAAQSLLQKGARTILVKLGQEGCWVENAQLAQRVPALHVENVVDTTGAGDAFAAGFIAATLHGKDLLAACRAANQTGAKVVQSLGAVEAWK